MFTGLVEEMGRIRALGRDGDGTTLVIDAQRVLDGVLLGDSICVDGACLTVTALDEHGFAVGLSPETLQRTNFGERRVGDRVSLERAAQIGARLGGHYVQGHVDAVGRLVAKQPEGDSLRLRFQAPADLMRYIVVKGYICVDGASLTITEREGDTFGVALVAYTQGAIDLPNKPIGATVNLEVDVIAKYVESLLEGRIEHGQQR